MTILYFSATGNSLAVAKTIGGELLSIPKLVKEGRYRIEDDTVGVIFPTYCADAPRMVREYLSMATICAGYTFAVCTYGYMAGAATAHAEQYLKAAAGHADYVAKIIMADTALSRFETQKQLDTLPAKQVEAQLRSLCADIEARKHGYPALTIVDRITDWLYHAAGASQVAPDKAKSHIVSDACVRCGVCARVCPADNISVSEKVIFHDRCEGCLACLHNCPQKAIHIKNEKSTVRFRNSEVTLAELIKANN